jgi:hypothetical protein
LGRPLTSQSLADFTTLLLLAPSVVADAPPIYLLVGGCALLLVEMIRFHYHPRGAQLEEGSVGGRPVVEGPDWLKAAYVQPNPS